MLKQPELLTDLKLLGILAFLGICVTLGAFGLYNWAITRMRAGQASMYINLVPVVAVIMGVVFLGETLTFVQMLAGGGVLIGVIVSQTGRRRTPQ